MNSDWCLAGTGQRGDGPSRRAGSGVEGGVSSRMRRGLVTVGGVAGIVDLGRIKDVYRKG